MPLATQVVGHGHPTVVLPSFSLDGQSMARAFEPAFLAQERASRGGGVTRIYVDLPGTGASPAVEPTSDAVLDAVVATVDEAVGRGGFSVVGWSYGGYLALGLLRRLPDRVASALLVCTATRIRPADRDLSGTMTPRDTPGWLDDVPAELHDHLCQAVGLRTATVAARVAALIAGNAPTDDTYLGRLRRDGFALADEDAVTVTDRPVVVLAGRRDRVAGYRSMVDALSGFDRGDLLLSATAGHYFPLEEPGLLVAGAARWTAARLGRTMA